MHEDALDEALLRNVSELLADARKELGEGAGIEESVTFTRRYMGIDLSKVRGAAVLVPAKRMALVDDEQACPCKEHRSHH